MTTILSQDTISNTEQRLHEILSPDDIEELCEIFQQAKDKKFNPHELRELLGKYNIYFDDEQFEILFLKINTNRDNHCDWDELVSHLLLGFRSDDLSGQKETLNLPIDALPTVRKVIHRYPVVRIRLCPTVMPDRSVNNASGSYITASKDGTVIYWTQNFELQRTEKSKNPNLKVSKTWVLDCIPLPDVHIVCTSSIERDLRFYDTTANNFSIRIIISRLPFAVYVMAYWFGETEYIDSRLILGDAGGNVWLLEFTPELRGPFQSKPGTALVQLTWNDLLHGKKLPLIRVSQFHRVHKDIVRQVEYCPNLNAIFSAAECRDISVGHTPAPGLVISDLGVQKTQTIFRMTKGVTCFAFDRENTVIATGGPDCMLRLWNHIMSRKPFAILPGHHCGIIFICLQDDGKKIYTIDRSKLVKVWDTWEQNLLQTFNLFSTAITDRTAITCFYNDNTRDLTIANMKFASVKCCPLLKLDKTDGNTHSRPLSVILYNDLFNSVVTCGLDSYIIVWNLWTGKRETFIKAAHTRMAHGGMLRLEITAACFDPKQQLLLTGARDGTLKIWNFNNGICVRNLAIEFMCEVTQVFWFNERILAVGWNKHVIEFSDTEENELGNTGKMWDICHNEDVLAAAAHPPQSLITSSYGGELVLWKLETGQPYRRYDVDTPAARIKIKYEGQKPSIAPVTKYSATKAKGLLYLRKSYRASLRVSSKDLISDQDRPTIYRTNKEQVLAAASRQRQVSIVQLPTSATGHKKTAVHSMICLTTRPCSPEFGTVFVALENGIIQVFSNHILGGYMTCFNAIHMAGDCVTSMTVDKTDRYLITGTALGYIKTWLVCNYCVPKSQIVHINWPELRLQFPFLIKSFFEGRAKRTFRNETELKLCNSYKAHMQPITSIAFLNESKIVLSASSDTTARIWTLAGRYIGTLGSPIKWEELVPSQPVRDGYRFRMPPDIKRCASSTTLKVLKGGQTEDPMSILIAQQKHKDRELKNEVKEGQPLITYGNSIEEPILGNNVELPAIEIVREKPLLDSLLPYIPIYSQLDYIKAEIISIPDTPELLKKCKMISFMGKKTK